MLSGFEDEVQTALGLSFSIQVLQMLPHRCRADAEFIANLIVAHAIQKAREDFSLAHGDAVADEETRDILLIFVDEPIAGEALGDVGLENFHDEDLAIAEISLLAVERDRAERSPFTCVGANHAFAPA